MHKHILTVQKVGVFVWEFIEVLVWRLRRSHVCTPVVPVSQWGLSFPRTDRLAAFADAIREVC